MSTRSQRSSATGEDGGGGQRNRRLQQKQRAAAAAPLSDDELYTYTLRVALLQHVVACRRTAVATASSSSHHHHHHASTTTTSSSALLAGAAAANAPASSVKRDSLRRTITEGSKEAWTSTFQSISLGDLFRSGSSSSSSGSSSGSSPRCPERFVKVLEHKIEDISRGSDPAYTDMLLRYTVGAFYGKFKDPKNLRMFRENRKLEDLLMMFIATATDVLRKRCSGDEWKVRLEGQVESFVRILEECLRNREVKHVPPELFVKLDTLRSRIVANRPPPDTLATPSSNGGQLHQHSVAPPTINTSNGYLAADGRGSIDGHSPLSASSSYTPTPSPSSPSSNIHVSFNLSDMPAALQVARVFNIDMVRLQQDVNAQKKYCTEKTAMADLKAISNLISSDYAFRSDRDDFQSEDAYQAWRSSELATLQQEMLAMVKLNPDLAQSDNESPTSSTSDSLEATVGNRTSLRPLLPIAEHFSSPSSYTSLAASFPSAGASATSASSPADTSISSSLNDGSLTFVPPDPRQAYKRLLEIMLSYDLAEMVNLDPTEEVPLRILSSLNEDLLADCVLRWRVLPTYRFVAFLEDMCRRYGAGEMPVVECVLVALGDFDKLNVEWQSEMWPDADLKAFLSTLSQLFDALLRAFYETFSEQLPQESVPPIIDALEQVADSALFERAIEPEDLEQRYEQLRDGIRRVSDFLYSQQRESVLQSHSPDSVIPLLDLIEWMKVTTKRADKKYRSPLLGAIDIPQLFLSTVPDMFLHDLQQRLHAAEPSLRKQSLMYTTSGVAIPETEPEPEGLKDGEIMALYTGVKELTEMHTAFCPNIPLRVSVNEQFEPYISRWLADTDKKTLTWVRTAINLDEFKPEEAEEGDGHTSSIVDLIASCKGAVQFVTDLGWPDEVQNAVFITKLSATVSKAIEQYCAAIEELFMRELVPPRRDSEDERDERTSAWITRAKALVQDKKLEMFVFKPTSCLKLNNIHAARQLLDKMYTTVNADRVALLTRSRTPARAARQDRNLFTIKVVLGEGLATSGGVSRVDPFVTLSDERGLRIAKTRTLYETSEPRWSETFDVSVEGKMWIAATAWNRNLLDEHELLGRSYIALDANVFGDCLPHDLWQELDTVGRLLLRVSMEGEKDDIQFFFGRAFRALKRAENDMTRIIVDKISPFIRSCISTASLRTLLKQGGMAFLTSNVKNLNLDKAFDKSRLDQVRKFMKTKDPHAPEIPLPPSAFVDRMSFDKPLPAAGPERKKEQGLTDSEIEQPLAPLLEYLDQSLETFRRYLSEPAWQTVMTKIWKEVLAVTESLLVPPLADQPTDMKPLSDREVDIVFKWLKFLTDFFYADGHGVPYEDLRNPRYRAVMNIRFYYDWTTDKLMEETVRLTNLQLTTPMNRNLTRTKSVFNQRNLGTIKQRKQEKNREGDAGEPEMVMRILRMRPGAIDFIQQQLATLTLVQEKKPKPTRLLGSMRGRGGRRGAHAGRQAGGPGHRTQAAMGRLPPTPSVPSDDSERWQQHR